MDLIAQISPEQPVLIAGPTASGKSALALEVAMRQGGVVINADAIQVFANWRVLTARPPVEDEARAAHLLYGHIAGDAEYSVGHWLREVAPLLEGQRPIIVGGTGLYFTALTEGLANIPPTPPEVRALADRRLAEEGREALLAELDAASRNYIDQMNPMRVQRAWEVLQTTGKGIRAWQLDTPPPLLPLAKCFPVVFDVDKNWLNTRIAQRFDLMLEQGALEEAEANLPTWNPAHLSAKAIGAPELIAHLQGTLTLDQAREAATIATRQFAKRQRTWFRARMKAWAGYTP
ncbi:tRNA (adenosine(37)-N6)-dimethylallyltransferase MiaA [Thalassobius sp. Cn5-15]|uniref:tRNA (adenosine(37)-N6)-dimethylallyltransferase MiaA n=1 Tax=Thalassobius sp. Cn5-15 TaxID=2917763 RepID=UPI001EF3C1E0|nr:tRNA (adenosine(37)-N6)-dimethylallyltransferase MiaA [Thalassobius sp. Cn5-15]MCG7492605.1 tRNA (adenosine(37)-N6)-dimethylallyltransferase MiaA [Thalassobius sp. Cn5-15]